MESGRQRMTALCRLGYTIAVSLVVLMIAWSAAVQYRKSLREARAVSARGQLAQLRLGFENYKTIYGRTLPRVSINSLGETTSWRVSISPFFDDKIMHSLAAQNDIDTDLRSIPEPSAAPLQLRLPYDTSDARFTSIVAIYDETDIDSKDPPWAIVAMTHTGIRWNEPRDLTISEFGKLIGRPYDTIQPIVVMTAKGQSGSIVGNSKIQFYFGSPAQPAIRDLLLQDNR